MSDLRGFRRVGLGYERKGFGDRTWRLSRSRGGFAIALELEPGAPDLIDDWAPELHQAIVICGAWDDQLEGSNGSPSVIGQPSGLIHGNACCCMRCIKVRQVRRAGQSLSTDPPRTSRTFSPGGGRGGPG